MTRPNRTERGDERETLSIRRQVLASIGILVARYYRQTWVGRQLMGKDVWFFSHRLLMAAAWALTLLALVAVVVELGGWTSLAPSKNPHAVIGAVCVALCFVQPVMAFFRPHPDAGRRYLFNCAHWVVGNVANILASEDTNLTGPNLTPQRPSFASLEHWNVLQLTCSFVRDSLQACASFWPWTWRRPAYPTGPVTCWWPTSSSTR